jgi:hypothetical protein
VNSGMGGGGVSNPWLLVPLSDYEGHMGSAEIRQLGALSDLFAEAMVCCHPSSVAVLGVAGGNGLEHVDRNKTTRIVGLDLNPLYLETVRQRYSYLAGLELHCIDLSEQRVELQPVELVHAALLFEHAGVGRCLDNALTMVMPGGHLSAVLQLPSDEADAVGSSRYSSVQTLRSHFSLVGCAWLRDSLAGRGLRLVHQAKRELPAGKGFWMGIFRAP